MNLNTLLKPYYVEGQKTPEITAVLKYIQNNTYRFDTHYSYDDNKNSILEIYVDMKARPIGEIPNKPLQFYTKTELTDLENLLTKLK